MKTSSLSLSAGSLLLMSLLSPAVASKYELVESWQGEEFFDYFHFYTGDDPTNGWVTYLDQASAESSGLVKVTDSGSVYIGVDHTTTLSTSGSGRDSVRVGTTKYYEHSLVVADLAHMPGSVCGSWPAFWTVGKEWPQDGEIDIIEGVNLQDHNEIVMHTAGTCALTDTGMSGTVNATGCGEALGTVGCVIEGQTGSYGTSFNNNGGGVYAMEWTEEFVKIWFFPRKSIPASITKGEPDVSEFGTPMALVQDGCDVANSFKAQSFVFDVTFCGDWAGGVFGESGCPMTSSDSFTSCTNFVAQNPAKFKETYWEINSVKVYQAGVKSTASAASHSSATHEVTQVAVTHHKATKTAAESRMAEASQASDSEATAAASKVGTEASVEESQASTHAKPAATRYVTEYVTGTTTVCASTEGSTAAAANAVVPSSHASHIAQVPETTQSTSSFEIEPPAGAGWKTSTEAPSEHPATPSAPTTAARHAAPSGAPAAQSPPAQTPSGADAVSINEASPRPPPSKTTSTAHQKPTAGPSGDSAAKPLATPSKPVIPKPSGDSAASTSGYQVYPGASNSASSPVFTGAADKFAVGYPMIAAAFGLALVA